MSHWTRSRRVGVDFHRSAAQTPLIESVRSLVDEAGVQAGDLDISAVITQYRRNRNT